MEIEKLKEKVREISLGISRVPIETKKTFIDLANAEFAGDYGMCLKWCLEQAIEFQQMKSTFFQNIDMKLDNILGIIFPNEKKETEPEKVFKKTFGGKRIELTGGNENE